MANKVKMKPEIRMNEWGQHYIVINVGIRFPDLNEEFHYCIPEFVGVEEDHDYLSVDDRNRIFDPRILDDELRGFWTLIPGAVYSAKNFYELRDMFEKIWPDGWID